MDIINIISNFVEMIYCNNDFFLLILNLDLQNKYSKFTNNRSVENRSQGYLKLYVKIYVRVISIVFRN